MSLSTRIRVLSCVLGLGLFCTLVILKTNMQYSRYDYFDKSIEYSNKTISAVMDITKNVTTKEYNWTAAAERFQKRLRHKRKVCNSYPPVHRMDKNIGLIEVPLNEIRRIWDPNLFYILDVPKRLLLCAVFKSGSSSWHETFWAIRRQRQNLSIESKYFTKQDWERNQGASFHLDVKIGEKLIAPIAGDDDFTRNPPEGSSYRMILARHPFARFISGWNQKFRNENGYWKTLFKTYRSLEKYKRKPTGGTHVVSFEDFATYAAQHQREIQNFDSHFRPAEKVCKTCELDFTYIIKSESSEIDAPWLKRRLGIENIKMPERNAQRYNGKYSHDVKANIKTYMSKLAPSLIREIYEIYKEDFALFGYTFNFSTLEAGGFE